MFRQNLGATTVEKIGGLSQDAKLHTQVELANQPGETNSEEEEEHDEDEEDEDDI